MRSLLLCSLIDKYDSNVSYSLGENAGPLKRPVNYSLEVLQLLDCGGIDLVYSKVERSLVY